MYPYLSPGEVIRYELQTKTGLYYVTNTRFLVEQSAPDNKSMTHEELNLDYIAHIHLSSKQGSNSRIAGAIITIVGIVIILGAYVYTRYGYGPYIIGGLFLLGGILLLLSKTDPVC